MPAGPFSRLSLAAAALALAAVAAAWMVRGGTMFSPGALHAGGETAAVLGGVPSHAALGRRCGACHVPPWSRETMDRRCLACHADIQADLRDAASLHGKLAAPEACRACHTEHRGPRANLTRFGKNGPAHDQFGFSLAAHRRTAAGQRFACGDCHAATTYRFEPERCASCHREYQPALIGRHVADWGSDCLACHDGRDRFSRGVFDHDRLRFRLTGAHRETACVACHAGARSLAGFETAPVDCLGCHRKDDEHRGEFGNDCGACHTTQTWKGARFEHSFPLDHGGRGRIACQTCHQDRTNYKLYTCYGCHEHRPARVRAEHAEEGIRDLDNCARCHPTGREEEAEREGEEHD